MSFPGAMILVRSAVVFVALHATFGFAQSIRVNPCVDGQGTPVGHRGVVTGCICGGMIYEINSNSNPCWKRPAVAKETPRTPTVPIAVPTPPRPTRLEPKVRLDSLLTVTPVATPTMVPVVAPKPVVAKKTPPPKKPVAPSKPAPVVAKPVVPAPEPAAPAPKIPTPLELEVAKNLKISRSLRQQIRKNDGCPTRESDYDQIRDRVYDLIEAKGTFHPNYAKPFIGKHARWCAWNPEMNRAIQGLISCKNPFECSVKCVPSRLVPGMSINVKYLERDRVYRMVGSSACVAWSNSWRDAPSLSKKLINAYSVGDLSFFPIGNGIYYAVITYLDRSFADAMKNSYFSRWDFYYVGIIYLPE